MIAPAHRLKYITEYYFSKKLEEIRTLEQSGDQVVNLGIGSPDQPPAPETINALIQTAKGLKNHAYQPYRSTVELREAIALWYGSTYGISPDPGKEILPLLGSKEGIMYVSLAFLSSGDEVLVPNPGYLAYATAAKMAGATLLQYNLEESNNWYPDLEELSSTDLSRVKLMWVNYPHMPTGASASKNLFNKLIKFAREKDILICHDNPYSQVLNLEPRSIISYDPEMKSCIELNSLSKGFNMAGWRVGMLIANEQVINTVLKVKSNIDSGMFLPVQHGAIEALSASASWHRERNNVYNERKKLAETLLSELGFSYSQNQVGMFVWAKAPDHISDVPEYLDHILQKARVFLTPGVIFGSQGQRYVRISLCSTKETFTEAITRIQTTIT